MKRRFFARHAVICCALALACWAPFRGGKAIAQDDEPREKKEKPLEVLIGELQSAERNVRRQAAFELAKKGQGARPALRPLLVAMDDPEPLVREAAACALGEIGEPAAAGVPLLIHMLQHDARVENRHMAVKALGKIGPPARESVKLLMDIARGGAGETGDLPFRKNKRPQPLSQNQVLRGDAIRAIGQTRVDDGEVLGFLLQVLQAGAADAEGYGAPYFLAAADAVAMIGTNYEPIVVALQRARRMSGNGEGAQRIREAADKALRKLLGEGAKE